MSSVRLYLLLVVWAVALIAAAFLITGWIERCLR
jgi:hypothetical protein